MDCIADYYVEILFFPFFPEESSLEGISLIAKGNKLSCLQQALKDRNLIEE